MQASIIAERLIKAQPGSTEDITLRGDLLAAISTPEGYALPVGWVDQSTLQRDPASVWTGSPRGAVDCWMYQASRTARPHPDRTVRFRRDLADRGFVVREG